MNYNDKSFCKILENYFNLTHAFEELDEVKRDEHGAVLDWVSTYYQQAKNSIEFLKKNTSVVLKKELKLGALEERLNNFANTHIKL